MEGLNLMQPKYDENQFSSQKPQFLIKTAVFSLKTAVFSKNRSFQQKPQFFGQMKDHLPGILGTEVTVEVRVMSQLLGPMQTLASITVFVNKLANVCK